MNPPNLAGVRSYFCPPLVLKPGVLDIQDPSELALKPDHPEAFSDRMQKIDYRTDRHGLSFLDRPLLFYLKTKWVGPNLASDCENLFVFWHLRYRSSSRHATANIGSSTPDPLRMRTASTSGEPQLA
jgi:hypothetical protein